MPSRAVFLPNERGQEHRFRRGAPGPASGHRDIQRSPEVGQRHKELWLDALLQRPGKLIKLAFTLFTLVEAIPRIWWVLVGEEIPAAFYRTAMQKVTGWHRARNSPKYGVELARLPGGLIAIRSRRSNPSILVFQPAEMADFLDAIKNGGYDAGSLTSDFR